MQRIISEFEARPSLRIALVLFVVLGVALIVVPGPVLSALALKATRYFGLYFVVLVIAAVVGWITYNRKVFYQIAAVGVIGLAVIQLIGLNVNQDFFSSSSSSTYVPAGGIPR